MTADADLPDFLRSRPISVGENPPPSKVRKLSGGARRSQNNALPHTFLIITPYTQGHSQYLLGMMCLGSVEVTGSSPDETCQLDILRKSKDATKKHDAAQMISRTQSVTWNAEWAMDLIEPRRMDDLTFRYRSSVCELDIQSYNKLMSLRFSTGMSMATLMQKQVSKVWHMPREIWLHFKRSQIIVTPGSYCLAAGVKQPTWSLDAIQWPVTPLPPVCDEGRYAACVLFLFLGNWMPPN
jgi:hypothetical protein